MATKLELDKERAATAEREDDPTPEQEMNAGAEVHTYPDGSQRVGRPPWPEKSPAEEAAELGEQSPSGQVGMQIPRGRPTSGETPPNAAGHRTESQFEARAVEQLTSNVLSGADPNAENPTTASDKPGLAGVTGETGELKTVLSADPTPEELEAIARSIEPKGNIEATPEEKLAAVQQVARETKGPVVADEQKKKSGSK